MSLLFDENISPKVCRALQDIYPGSESIYRVGLSGASDSQIWSYAQRHNLIIVSKDSDFVDRAIFSGTVRVVHLRAGNCGSDEIVRILSQAAERIRAFRVGADLVLELI